MLMRLSDLQQLSNDVMNMLHEEELEIINSFHDAVLAKDSALIAKVLSRIKQGARPC